MASLNFRKIVFSLYFGHPYGKKREETGFSYAKSGLFSLFLCTDTRVKRSKTWVSNHFSEKNERITNVSEDCGSAKHVAIRYQNLYGFCNDSCRVASGRLFIPVTFPESLSGTEETADILPSFPRLHGSSQRHRYGCPFPSAVPESKQDLFR